MSEIERADLYFKDGKPYMVGVFGSEAYIGEGGVVVPPPGNGEAPAFDWQNTPITWKAKGEQVHPDIGNGDLSGRYVMFGGKVVFLQIYLEMGSTTNFAGNTPYWYFQPPAAITPDFDGSSKAHDSAGSVLAWTGGSEFKVGTCWWSKPGGTPPHGIRVAFDFNKQLNKTTPATWVNGDRLRMSLMYELP